MMTIHPGVWTEWPNSSNNCPVSRNVPWHQLRSRP